RLPKGSVANAPERTVKRSIVAAVMCGHRDLAAGSRPPARGNGASAGAAGQRNDGVVANSKNIRRPLLGDDATARRPRYPPVPAWPYRRTSPTPRPAAAASGGHRRGDVMDAADGGGAAGGGAHLTHARNRTRHVAMPIRLTRKPLIDRPTSLRVD